MATALKVEGIAGKDRPASPGFDFTDGKGEKGRSGALSSARSDALHNPKGHLIILNGVGSADKGSTAKALQQLMPTPWLHIKMDKLREMLPERCRHSTCPIILSNLGATDLPIGGAMN